MYIYQARSHGDGRAPLIIASPPMDFFKYLFKIFIAIYVMIKMKDLKIISLRYYLNDNLIIYKYIYTEFSQIAKRTYLNYKYTS